MNSYSIRAAAAAALVVAATATAHAQMAAPNPQLREASPDAIPMTASPRMPAMRDQSWERIPNGELSTEIGGRPNVDPAAPRATSAMARPDTRAMGAPRSPMTREPGVPQMRGTPD